MNYDEFSFVKEGAVVKSNGESPLSDLQQLKELNEKFAKMKLVLKNTKLELKNKGLQEKLKQQETKALLAKIEAENGKMKNEIEKMQAKMDEKEKQLEKKEEKLEKEEEQLEKKEEQLDKKEEQLEQLEKKEEQLEKKEEQLEKKEEQYMAKLEQLQKKVKCDAEEEENRKMRSAQNEMKEKLDKLEEQLGRKLEKEEAEAENRKMKNEIEKMQAKFEKKEEQYMAKLEELQKNIKLMEQIVKVQTKVDKLEMGVSTDQIEHFQNEQKRKINALEKEQKLSHMKLTDFAISSLSIQFCLTRISSAFFTLRFQSKIYNITLLVSSPSDSLPKSGQNWKEQLFLTLGTYAYSNDGYITIDGKRIEPKEDSFKLNDIVGCGINPATRQIFFTKNGLRRVCPFYLDANSPCSVPDELFPFVSLLRLGDKIEANFGPHFKFNLATL
ncbi:hypothetical protein niasHT_002450 [Heterodera trifolii]|uniref:B30.2/SPRY domain-containing protein n=1 Tax=Heterodera trifolii TaxID=157864 RepID=A0ABD2LNA0_9BILA